MSQVETGTYNGKLAGLWLKEQEESEDEAHKPKLLEQNFQQIKKIEQEPCEANNEVKMQIYDAKAATFNHKEESPFVRHIKHLLLGENLIAQEEFDFDSKLIGKGGFANVYALSKTKALKVVSLNECQKKMDMTKDKAKEYLDRETSINQRLFKIKSTYILNFEASTMFNLAEDVVAVHIMPRCVGNLEDYIKFKPFDLLDIYEILYDVANAMQAYRTLGILHLDITPKNIFFNEICEDVFPDDRDNVNSNKVKYLLGDFGISKIGSVSKFKKKNPKLYNNTGVAGYCKSPEQQDGNKPLYFSSDIYNLGKAIQIIRSPSKNTNVSLNDSINKIIDKMVSSNQEDRYQDPDELFVALAAFKKEYDAQEAIGTNGAAIELRNKELEVEKASLIKENTNFIDTVEDLKLKNCKIEIEKNSLSDKNSKLNQEIQNLQIEQASFNECKCALEDEINDLKRTKSDCESTIEILEQDKQSLEGLVASTRSIDDSDVEAYKNKIKALEDHVDEMSQFINKHSYPNNQQIKYNVELSKLKTNDGDFKIVNNELKAYYGDAPYVRVPDGVEKVAKNAFRNKGELNKIYFPYSCKEICTQAVVCCENLDFISCTQDCSLYTNAICSNNGASGKTNCFIYRR